MTLYNIIDTDTGKYVEFVILDSHPPLTEIANEEITLGDGSTETIETVVNILDDDGQPIPDPQYIAEPVPPGFYWPRWDGAKWVEGGQAPEPTPQEPTEKERLDNLENTILMLLMTGG